MNKPNSLIHYPIMQSIRFKKVETFKILLKHSQNYPESLNCVNGLGQTPLSFLCSNNNLKDPIYIEMFEALLNNKDFDKK